MKRMMARSAILISILGFITMAQAQQRNAPDNFYAYSTSVFEEGDDLVEIQIGGFRAEEVVHWIHQGTAQYQKIVKYTKLDRSDEIWKYSRKNKEWIQLTPYDESGRKVPAMAGHAALQAKLDGYVYCFGGRAANGDSSVYMFNVRTGKWRPLAIHKFYDYEAMAAAVDFRPGSGGTDLSSGTAVFHGGVHDGRVSDELFIATFDQNGVSIENRGATPRALYGHAALYDHESRQVHFFGGSNAAGPQFENYLYDVNTRNFGWGPPIKGDFIAPRSHAPAAQEGNSLFLWGGSGYAALGKGSTRNAEVIRSDLCAITVKNGQLYSRVLARDLPPIAHGALSVHIDSGDTVLTIHGGLSAITAEGDTMIDTTPYRYSLVQQTVQKFDTTTAQWTGLQTGVAAPRFPISPELNLSVPVYPNPSAGMVTFAIQENMSVRAIRIYNQLGQLVMRLSDPGEYRLDLRHQPAGLYYLRIDTSIKPLFGKILIQ